TPAAAAITDATGIITSGPTYAKSIGFPLINFEPACLHHYHGCDPCPHGQSGIVPESFDEVYSLRRTTARRRMQPVFPARVGPGGCCTPERIADPRGQLEPAGDRALR